MASLITILLCALAPIASAEVYKWTDAQGNVHFGDKPPAGKSETINLPTHEAPAVPAVSEDRIEKQKRLLDAYAEERRLKNETDEKARKEKAERKQRCADLRDDLRNQEDAGSIYTLDKNGERVYLSNEQREASTAALRKEVEYWCGK